MMTPSPTLPPTSPTGLSYSVHTSLNKVSGQIGKYLSIIIFPTIYALLCSSLFDPDFPALYVQYTSLNKVSGQIGKYLSIIIFPTIYALLCSSLFDPDFPALYVQLYSDH